MRHFFPILYKYDKVWCCLKNWSIQHFLLWCSIDTGMYQSSWVSILVSLSAVKLKDLKMFNSCTKTTEMSFFHCPSESIFCMLSLHVSNHSLLKGPWARQAASGTVASSWVWSLTSPWRGKWKEYFPTGNIQRDLCIIMSTLSVPHRRVFVCVYFPEGQAEVWRRGRRPWARRTGRRSAWSWRRCSWSSECKSSRFENSLQTRLAQVNLILEMFLIGRTERDWNNSTDKICSLKDQNRREGDNRSQKCWKYNFGWFV